MMELEQEKEPIKLELRWFQDGFGINMEYREAGNITPLTFSVSKDHGIRLGKKNKRKAYLLLRKTLAYFVGKDETNKLFEGLRHPREMEIDDYGKIIMRITNRCSYRDVFSPNYLKNELSVTIGKSPLNMKQLMDKYNSTKDSMKV